MLSKKPMSFSEMLGVLGVTSSFLTYHLENLGELVGKIDDGKYKLSSFGEAAMATMTKVEDIPTTAPQQSPEHPETRSQKWSRPLRIIARAFKISETKASETKPKKVVGRNVAIALGLICILLTAFIAYFSITSISAQNSYNNLQNQNKQLQTWLDGNETLLNQAQTNNTNLQNQINQLNATIANLEKVANLQESTVIAQDYSVAIPPNSSTVIVSNNTVLPEGAPVLYFNGSVPIGSYHIDHVDINYAGYIVVEFLFSPNSTVELEYSSNGVNYSSTVNFEGLNGGLNGSARFPVLPTSTLNILVGNTNPTVYLINAFNATEPIVLEYIYTVTITYYY